jgi:hypothetical protein
MAEEMKEEKFDMGPHVKLFSSRGRWVEMDDDDIREMYESMFKWSEEEEIDNLDWSRLSFEVYDEHYYRERFPGFPDEFYKILEECSQEENAVQDFRNPPLRIDNDTEVTLSFR